MPEVRTALGIAVGAFLLDPHRGRQDQVGRKRRHRGIGVGNDDEIFGIAEARIGLLVDVGAGLQIVVDLNPIGIEQAVLQHPALQHRVIAGLVGNGALGQLPDLLRHVAVRLVGDDHVGGQPVREGADLARGAAGRGLAGQRERAVAGLGNLPGQQMNVVDEVIAPDAAGVLVEPHGPEADHLGLRISVELGQRLEPVERHAGHLGRLLQRVVGNELRIVIEVDIGRIIGLGGAGRLLLQRVFGTQPIADVGLAALERWCGRRRSPC